MSYIGWGLFITLALFVLGFVKEQNAGFGGAFGYPVKGANWMIIIIVIILMWCFIVAKLSGISICFK